MITKGIVEEIINKNKVKVRIPIYDKVASAASAIKAEDLSIAIISTLPGIIPALNIGDIVIIDFEQDLKSKPIILGVLFNDNFTKSSININAISLNVDINCTLPADTTIGNISGEEIQKLKNIEGNIQGQINELKQRLKVLESGK